MRTCSCGRVMEPIRDTGATYCTHCDRPCPNKVCIPCNLLNTVKGPGR